MKLTVGMPTYRDYDGVYFTLQALRLYHELPDVEYLVVDNFLHEGKGCEDTRRAVENAGGRYVHAPEVQGTAAAKEKVFTHAAGDLVVCLDCHVLLVPGALEAIVDYFAAHPESRNLVQGPLLYDDKVTVSTHLHPVWRGQMFGIWATDDRYKRRRPFEIPMQGMGMFAMLRQHWPGFSPHFRGFGGEEGYIHEKVRQQGGKCLCLPAATWMHRFGRPQGTPYPLRVVDKIANYLIGHRELGLNEQEVLDHFQTECTLQEIDEALRRVDAVLPRCGELVRTWTSGLPLVSCLCPTYNRLPQNRQLLEECIESFLLQDYPNKELVLLNDTPGQQIEVADPRVRVLNVAERFPSMSAKMEAALTAARGELLMRWDDDDIHLPHRISKSVEMLGTNLYWRPANYWFDDGVVKECAQHANVWITGIWRRALLEKIGGYPANCYGEDDVRFENCCRAAGLVGAAPVLAAEEIFYVYRWNTDSVHLSGSGGSHADYKKHWRQHGKAPIVPGTFVIVPRWHANYRLRVERARAGYNPDTVLEPIGGYFTFPHYYQHIAQWLPLQATVVEVGSLYGASIIQLARATARKRTRLIAVDSGVNVPGYSTADTIPVLWQNLKRHAPQIGLLALESLDAAALFADESLDFVFIDAAHDYASVRADLRAWWPKVKKGGILAGHDYEASFPGVVKAVNEFFRATGYELRFQAGESCFQVVKDEGTLQATRSCGAAAHSLS